MVFEKCKSLCHFENDKKILHFWVGEETEIKGLSIFLAKKRMKPKYKYFDLIMFNSKTFEKILKWLENPKGTVHFQCICGSEILQLSVIDDEVFFNIFDNFFYKHRRFFKSEFWLYKNQIPLLLKELEKNMSEV